MADPTGGLPGSKPVAASVREVRLFVSSPGDARFERSRLERVAERLNGEFQDVARIVPIRWETEFYKAHATFQAQIPEAAQCDIVVAIFRGRLGTELPADFPRMANGEPYPSGTAYEILSAIDACKAHGLPDVFVFRFPQPPSVQLDDPGRVEIEAQWEHLKSFFDSWFKSPQGQFKAAFQSFASTDDFEVQVESLLRKWLEEKVLHGRSLVWPAEIKGSPFRGLASFGSKHAPVFFGRSRDISKAVDRLKDAAERGSPFLLVDGPSGGGKSSLVRAGIVPRLTSAGVVPSVDVWRVAVMRPGEVGGDPFAALARELFIAPDDLADDEQGRLPALPELRAGPFSQPEDLAGLLAHGDASALKPIIAALATIEAETHQKEGFDRGVKAALLLVVDQLDELFGSAIGDEVRGRFARLLGLLARSGRVWVIATLRADLFDRFLAQPDLRALKEDGAAYDLVPPDAAELAEIVRAPALAADLVYETDPATNERLDERLLKDADRPDLLPLVQFTLNQLFEAREPLDHGGRLTFAAYRQLGGIEGAVEKEAEAAFAKLGEPEQARLPRLLRELVVPASDPTLAAARSGFDIRSVPLADLANDEPLAKLVQALVDARILLSAGEGQQATVRLAHARVLDSWRRASRIVADNADFYRVRAEVEQQRRRWEAAGRRRDLLIGRGRPLAEAESIVRRFSEELPAATREFVQRSGRRARLAQTLTAAAAVVFAAVAVAAAVEWRHAVNAQRDAQAAQQFAELERDRAEQALTAATRTANGLIFDLAQRFRNVLGVPASLIKDLLDRARALQEQLAASELITPDLHRSEAVALTETASTLLTIGDTAGALAAAERARQIMDALLATNPANVDWQQLLSIAYNKIGDVLMAQGKLDDALKVYRDGLAIRERLAAADPSNEPWQAALSVSHERIGDVLMKQGKLDDALKAYSDGLAIAERLVGIDPSNTLWRRDLSVSYSKVGDVLMEQGKLDDALKAYRDDFAIAERLAAADPSNTQWQRDLSISYNKVGDVLMKQGKLDDALTAYSDGLAIAERLAAADRSNAHWQHDLSIFYSRIANVLMKQGKLDDALKAYQDSLAIIERLAAADRSNTQWQRSLSISYDNIGDVLVAQGKLDDALKAYRDGLAIKERLAAADRGNTEWQRDLSISYNRIGNVLLRQGKLDDALKAYRDDFAIAERLAAADPSNTEWQGGLSVSYDRIGDVLVAQGKRDDALKAYQDSLAIRERLAAADPSNTQWRRDLAVSYDNIGDVLEVQGKLDHALKAYRNGLAIRERLAAADPGNAQWQRDLQINIDGIGGLA